MQNTEYRRLNLFYTISYGHAQKKPTFAKFRFSFGYVLSGLTRIVPPPWNQDGPLQSNVAGRCPVVIIQHWGHRHPLIPANAPLPAGPGDLGAACE